MKIKTILVSQPEPTDVKSPYHELGRKYGLKIDFKPFIKVEAVPAQDFRQERINILDHSAIVLTSRNAVDHFFRMCKELRLTVPESMKYFCVSESVAYYVQKYIVYRKRKVFIGKNTFQDLLDVIKKHKDEVYLVPCSDIQKAEIPALLDKAGVKYTNAVFYRTVASDLSDLKNLKYDMLVFFSPAGIESLFKNFPKFDQNGAVIAAFGPTTSKAVRDAGLRLDIEAPLPEAPSMTGAIELYIKRLGKKKSPPDVRGPTSRPSGPITSAWSVIPSPSRSAFAAVRASSGSSPRGARCTFRPSASPACSWSSMPPFQPRWPSPCRSATSRVQWTATGPVGACARPTACTSTFTTTGYASSAAHAACSSCCRAVPCRPTPRWRVK